MLTGQSSVLSAADFLITISNIGIFGWLIKILFNKIANSCTRDEVKIIVSEAIQTRETILEIKLEALTKKIDQFIELVMKDAHLKLND